MESRILKNSIFLALILVGIFLFAHESQVYGDKTTHPGLTNEVARFFNYYAIDKLTSQEIVWLKQGSVEEDVPPRWVNHFYDPIYDKGYVLGMTSKLWAQNSQKQAGFAFASLDDNGFSNSDYSWDRAIYDYKTGNKQRAFIALGHILHLIEDATVPDHTRLDVHLGDWKVFNDQSPYEEYTRQFNDQNLNLSDKYISQNLKPVLYDSLNEYFDKTANYSNNRFFSEDTIDGSNFTLPNLNILHNYEFVKEENGFIQYYGILKDGDWLYKLVRLEGSIKDNIFTSERETINDPLILSDYWSRLSQKSIINGAGVIALFLKQARSRDLSSLNVYKYQSLASLLANLFNSENNQEPNDSAKSDDLAVFDFERDSGDISAVETEDIYTNYGSNQDYPNYQTEIISAGYQESDSNFLPALTPVFEENNSTSAADEIETMQPIGGFEAVSASSATSTVAFLPVDNLGTPTFPEKIASIATSSQEPLPQEPEQNQAASTAPLAISDFAAEQGVERGLVNLSWSIPLGAEYFDIRFSQLPIIDLSASDSVSTASEFSIWKDLATSSVLASGSMNSISASFFEPEQNYYFAIKSVNSAGESAISNIASFSAPNLPGSVVFSEIGWMGDGYDSSNEWIELYNRSEQEINLENWRLKGGHGGPDIIFGVSPENQASSLSLTIPSHGYFLIKRTADDFYTQVSADWAGSFGSGAGMGLDNSCETMSLIDPAGKSSDFVPCSGSGSWLSGTTMNTYYGPAAIPMSRVSMEWPSSDPENWDMLTATPQIYHASYLTLKSENIISKFRNPASVLVKDKFNRAYLFDETSIVAGDVLEMRPGAKIAIISGNTQNINFNFSEFKVKATPDDPAVIESYEAGQWGRITLMGSTASVQNLIVKNSGRFTESFTIDGSDACFDNLKIENPGNAFLRSEDSKIAIENSVFDGNNALLWGFSFNDSEVSVKNSVFKNMNICIDARNSNVLLENVVFENCGTGLFTVSSSVSHVGLEFINVGVPVVPIDLLVLSSTSSSSSDAEIQ